MFCFLPFLSFCIDYVHEILFCSLVYCWEGFSYGSCIDFFYSNCHWINFCSVHRWLFWFRLSSLEEGLFSILPNVSNGGRVLWLTELSKSFESFSIKESYHIHIWIESKIVNTNIVVYNILHDREKNSIPM